MGSLGMENGLWKKDKSISHLGHCLEFLKKKNQEYKPDLGSSFKDGAELKSSSSSRLKLAIKPAIKEWSKKDKNTFTALARELQPSFHT